MKILYVHGEEYSALEFEDKYDSKEYLDIWNKAFANCDHNLTDEDMEITAMEFGDVDPAFMDFINYNFVDYDQSKTANFYTVGEL